MVLDLRLFLIERGGSCKQRLLEALNFRRALIVHGSPPCCCSGKSIQGIGRT